MRLRSLLGVVVVLFIPASVGAQTVASSPADLGGHVKPSDTLYVWASSQPVEGKLVGLSTFVALSPSIHGRHQDFNLAAVTRTEQERRAMKKGALIGLLAGGIALPTAMAVIRERNCGDVRGTIHACDDEWSTGKIVLVFGSIGGGIGAAIGAAIAHRKR